MALKKVGVLLSGCGVFDGSEIHEAVITLLALDRAGVQSVCMAPNVAQLHVVDHLTQRPTDETRNVLTESARIARGEISDLADVSAEQLDAIIIPGGFGAAKNLSDFAIKGAEAVVNPEVKRIVKEMVTAGKPVGAICIAPATLAKALEDENVSVTIGKDEETAAAIEATGNTHIPCTVDTIHFDPDHNIVTTPAYMLGPGIKDVADGIEKLVQKVVALLDS
jgi:enhancing lycopene biosynthesis protein 2